MEKIATQVDLIVGIIGYVGVVGIFILSILFIFRTYSLYSTKKQLKYFEEELASKQENLDPEINDIVNKNFWKFF